MRAQIGGAVLSNLEVQLLPALSDNYIFLLNDPHGGTSGVVDPGEADPVINALEEHGRGLDWIINTHHHDDHIAGNSALIAKYGAKLAAPEADRHRIASVDQCLSEGDSFKFGSQIAEIYSTPGHTSGHISLWFAQSSVLFTGDTLFALGCGRLFEGTPLQMWESLNKYNHMPDETIVYCGHEYTAANAKFALSVDPENSQLKERAEAIAEARRRGAPTVPTDLGIERKTNPFLRASSADIRENLGMTGATDIEVFTEIRRRKDNF